MGRGRLIQDFWRVEKAELTASSAWLEAVRIRGVEGDSRAPGLDNRLSTPLRPGTLEKVPA